jgi:peptidoglycan/LPS O-acetylase OafA/YrhL
VQKCEASHNLEGIPAYITKERCLYFGFSRRRYMKENRSNVGALVGGALLIGFGLLSLAGELFRNAGGWSLLWPFTVMLFGGLFFAAMFAAGRDLAALAIPGSIIAGIGLLLLYQNLTSHWESWSYAWALIVVFVGVGIYIMGWYSRNEAARGSGLRVMRTGLILFVIFGGIFEMLFSISHPVGWRNYVFPVLLILTGLYLVVSRLGLLGGRKSEETDASLPAGPKA